MCKYDRKKRTIVSNPAVFIKRLFINVPLRSMKSVRNNSTKTLLRQKTHPKSKTEALLIRIYPDVQNYKQDFVYSLYRVCNTQMPGRCLGLVLVLDTVYGMGLGLSLW